MAERERQLDFGFDLPEINENERGITLSNVPSDDESNFILSLHAGDDVFIQLTDKSVANNDNWIYLPPMRLRSYNGGGLNPYISEELSALPGLFRTTNGQTDPRPINRKTRTKDRISSDSIVKITKEGRAIRVLDIQDDDDQSDQLSKFLDIEVMEDGNVKVAMRNTRHKLNENEWVPIEEKGEMLFKTKENGGKYPLMASIFTRLAHRIANARDGRDIIPPSR